MTLFPPIYQTSQGTPRDLGSLLSMKSQGFGENVAYYRLNFGTEGHAGLDLPCNIGTPLYASHNGAVKSISLDPQRGMGVLLSCPEGLTLYWHLSQVDVIMGQVVKVGQKLGLSGNTGKSTGAHLHFEWRPNPLQVNNGFSGAADPVPSMVWQPLPVSDETMTKTVVDLLYEILEIGDLDGSGRAYWIGKPIQSFLKEFAKNKGNKLITLSQ